MIKTIKQIQPTNHFHEAIGRLYKLTFTDGSTDFVYEETFFYQYDDYRNEYEYLTENDLVGRKISLEEGYFNYTPPTLV